MARGKIRSVATFANYSLAESEGQSPQGRAQDLTTGRRRKHLRWWWSWRANKRKRSIFYVEEVACSLESLLACKHSCRAVKTARFF